MALEPWARRRLNGCSHRWVTGRPTSKRVAGQAHPVAGGRGGRPAGGHHLPARRWVRPIIEPAWRPFHRRRSVPSFHGRERLACLVAHHSGAPARPALRSREETSIDCVNAGFRTPFDRRNNDRGPQRSGVAVRRTSGPMRPTSSRWKRLASAMLGAPGPASAGLPPPPINTGAM
jgi:hypothetical protein